MKVKRLLSCIIAVSALFAVLPNATAKSNGDYKETTNKMTAFGFITSVTGSSSTEVTRADFYNIVKRAVNVDSVTALEEMGIVPTGSDGSSVNMSKKITYDEAVEVLVRALGYGKLVDAGTSAGSIASDIKLTDGVKAGGTLNREQMNNLILNAAETEVMGISEINDGAVWKKGATLLEQYRGIYKVEGIVDAAEGISLTSSEGKAKSEVSIDGELYQKGKLEVKDMLGKSVEAYYTDDSDNTLIYIGATDENKEYVVNAEDIAAESTQRGKFYWYDDDGNEKKIKISPVADMVYNGQGYPDFTEEDLTPENGYIRLTDNNGDGTIDVIFVNDYKTIVVDNASSVSETILAKYTGETVDLSKYDEYTITKNGEEISVGGIKAWNIVYLLESKDKTTAELLASDTSVSGELTAYSPGKGLATINDVEYKINPTFEKIVKDGDLNYFKLGRQQTWYLDPDGQIAAAYYQVASENLYGYVFKTWMEEEELYAKILTAEDVWASMKFKKNAKFNGEKTTAEIMYTLLDPRQLVRYKTNSSGEITAVETAEQVNFGSDSEKFRKMTIYGIYRTEDASFSNAYYMSSPVVFEIPTGKTETGANAADDTKLYSVGGWGYADYTAYTLDFYDPDLNNCTSVIVYNKPYSTGVSTDSSGFLVDTVYKGLSGDDEVVQKVSGMVKGQNLQLTANTDGMFDNLKRGDMIRYSMNNDGRISAFSVLQEGTAEKIPGNVISTDLHVSSGAILKGNAVRTDAEKKFLTIEGSTGKRVIKMQSTTMYSMYDSKRDKVYAADFSEIKEGDFLVIYVKSSKVQDVAIYR